ncbi:MAG: AAA family ATPase [Lachnospiraceae bacterium]|jgi:predicted AAA+ superfamily ATPase|nr:AAA family ATPase [Lachnospiraceae bacterium]
MTLKRKAYGQLLAWKRRKTRQGLLVTGARQVGKTYLIREFAKEQYGHFAEINLIENRQAASVLDAAESAQDLLMRMSVLAETELVPGETLIFIDEVQMAKETVTSIKFLVEKGGYDFIISGSLLGVELKNIRSVPVGYLDTVSMYPLDFMEYCLARGIPEAAMAAMGNAFTNREALPEYLHERFMSRFSEYLIVGGMPAVVAEFIDSGNIQTVRRLQENLIWQYKQDITKYNEPDSLIIKDIYDLIPSELNNQNKRFILKNMNEHARYGKYQECFVWLADAGVALPVYNANEPRYPLKLSKASNLFKLFMNDVGMLTSTFMRDTTIAILGKAGDVNYGSIYENMVAQELASHGHELYYYRSKKWGELDFLVETKEGRVIPIEVKSGKAYKRHRALDNVLAIPEYGIEEAMVFHDGNVLQEGKVSYLPIYMVSQVGL